MSPLLWVVAIGLAVVVGLLALAGALGRSAVASTSAIADPRFTTMEFGDLPSWVRHRLTVFREQFLTMGFSELTSYTRQSRRVNYTCVLVASDGTTVVEIWAARSRGLMLWVVAPMLGWSAFKNELLALPRYGLLTHFPEGRVVETSPVEILAKNHVVGETEFVMVPPSMPLAEVAERHAVAIHEFAGRTELAPVRIGNVEEFLNCERAMAARIAAKLRRDLGI